MDQYERFETEKDITALLIIYMGLAEHLNEVCKHSRKYNIGDDMRCLTNNYINFIFLNN